MKVTKEKYLKPKQCVLEMQPCELLVISLGEVNTNLDEPEKIYVTEEEITEEEGFWGR